MQMTSTGNAFCGACGGASYAAPMKHQAGINLSKINNASTTLFSGKMNAKMAAPLTADTFCGACR